VRQFNQLGIRRKRALGKKLPGQIRVLVVGGSTTFGERIPEEERTWPYLLEVELRKALGPRTEVVNAGVPGYNVVENLLHYLLLLDGLDPDVVVLAVGLNDVHPRLVGELWPDYRNLRVPWRGNVIPEPIEALRWSRLYRYFFLRGLSFKEQHIYEVVARPWPPESTFAAQLRRNGAGIYRRHLENFVLLVQARGRKAVLVPQPFFAAESWEEHFAPAVEEHNEIGRRVASELGAVYLERSAALMTAADAFDDCHFTEAGSAKYARALAQELLAAGVFAREPVPTP
jgi:lysophospholipase L1-like esterase